MKSWALALVLTGILFVVNARILVASTDNTGSVIEHETAPAASAESEVGDGDVVSAWRRSADRAGLDAEAIQFVSDLICEALPKAKRANIDSGIVRSLESSLDAYLDQFHPGFSMQKQRKGSAYWVAWLIASAIERPKCSTEELTAIRESFQQLQDAVVACHKQELWKLFGEEEAKAYEKYIDAGAQFTRQRLDAYFELAQNDLLFPALRKPVTQEIRDKIVEKLRGEMPNMIRKMREAPLMVLKEEAVSHVLKKHYRSLSSRVMFDVMLRENLKEWNKTKYWGYMKFKSWSCRGRWPINMGFIPDDDLNKVKGWVRDAEPVE